MTIAEILQNIENEIITTHWSVWIAIGMAIPYLILAAREKVACWYFGIVSCLAWAYAAFFLYDLYVDALLQLFYVGISFLGIYQWKFGIKSTSNKSQKGNYSDILDDELLTNETSITKLTIKEHASYILGGLVLTALIGYFFSEYTPAASTYTDAFTTVFSVIVTFMVIQKKIDNWAYWLVIDSVYVYLYWIRGGYFFALLFVIYLVIVVVGWRAWWRTYQGYTKGAT